MITACAFLALAGAGALARSAVGGRWNVPGGLPLGTLAVNVAGSAALGLLHGVGAPAITVVGTGMLGAFTTFSSFVRDTVALAETGRGRLAVAYLAASLTTGLLAAAAGLALAG